MNESKSQSTPSNGTTGTDNKSAVRGMFNRVARRYDRLNHLLSFGLDIYWRRQAIRLINFRMNRRVLDLATGTGDLALLAAKQGATKIIGVDNAEDMLDRAVMKFRKKELDAFFYPVCCDAEQLALRDESVDAVMCAFGIRNVSDISRALDEVRRVLTSSGVIMILEFSKPRFVVIRSVFKLYFKWILPFAGSLISDDKQAYRYLPESVDRFMSRKELSDLLKEKHFSDVRSYSMTCGIVTVYVGMKL